MRVGITVDIRHSMFSAGHPNSCIAVAEVFQTDSHEVIFLHKETEKAWWDDVTDIEACCIHIDEAKDLDLVIEIGYFLTPLQRQKVSKCVWYSRKQVSFTDIESTIYGSRPEGRDLEGISEIWLANLFNTQDDIEYVNLLYPGIPVNIVPWIWSPTIVETHRKSMSSPVWLQVKEHVEKSTKWSVHIAESNFSNTSSCTIPLITLQQRPDIEKITVHNTTHIEKNDFFKANILGNSEIKDCKLVARQRIIDWSHEPNSIILSHSRFIPLKPGNLEAAWVGIPVVHNNPVLRDFGCGLEKTYYEGNNILEARSIFNKILDSHTTIPYLSELDALTELRRKILYKFSPEANAKDWLNVLKSPGKKKISEEKSYTILFTDMWDQFNAEYNMFTIAFSNYLKGVKVIGTTDTKVRPDIHIFGPFGSVWKEIKGPKIHYTGENTEPIVDRSVKLNLGFQYSDDPSYLRLPLWMLNIDWFNCDLSKIQNPLPIPVEACMNSCYKGERSKFCAFIVSNPRNQIRNEAFNILNEYKPVDSAGNLFNNVGPVLAAGLGGGGGELKKHEFLKDYRFCIAYENQSSDGYTTEKLLHAKAAGCVPIYWGDPLVGNDFDTSGFINLTGCPEDLLERVKELEENPELLEKVALVPAVTPEKRVVVLETFNEMVRRSLNLTMVVTSATANFWPYLLRWLNAIRAHTQSIRNLRARVYVGSDVTDAILNAAIKEYDFAEFIRFPTSFPEGFKDFWNTKHYAWKIWILNNIVSDPIMRDNIVLYMDCASVLIRWPSEWLKQCVENEISFLEDNTQKNKHWCHDTFCSILQVTDNEKESQQIQAGHICFVAGKEKPLEFFKEAYRLACNRNIIAGEKWLGYGKDGHQHGHRHDQSIMSILSQRHNLHRYPMNKIYNDKSARSTYFNGQSIYVHRGDYKTHEPVAIGIDDAFVVNLKRRPDRMASFKEKHSFLVGIMRRHEAVDGRALTLNSNLMGLFRPNDFFWKKAVMGCALSHLKLWTTLSSDSPEIKSYLIMEDDGRLQEGWKEAWTKVYSKIPDDWECVYLGGVLPPNKEGFKTVLEPVVPGLSRIAPNTFFGQALPTRQFHFCTYAYVISRAGVKKILESIQQNGGIWTSADHLLFNSLNKEHVYVLDPLVASASQDDDPAYLNSDFNDFSRIDKFDSDLWNNDDRFTEDEIKLYSKNATLRIGDAVRDAYSFREAEFVSLDTCKLTDEGIYEGPWLQELFGTVKFTIKPVSKDYIISHNNLYVCIIRGKWLEQMEWIENLCNQGKKFKILHFSDEFRQDPVFFYDMPEIRGIIRFYRRDDINNNKVLTIPLGYHWKNTNAIIPITKREYTWSFVGTNWMDRSEQLSPLNDIQPCLVQFYTEWKHPNQLDKDEYLELLLKTVFVPCPGGNNTETFRFYEALECGCIPVFVELPAILINSKHPFVESSKWTDVKDMINDLTSNKNKLVEYHKTIMNWWSFYKFNLRNEIVRWNMI